MFTYLHSKSDDSILVLDLTVTGAWWRLVLVNVAPCVLAALSLQSCSQRSCSLIPRAEHFCMCLQALQSVCLCLCWSVWEPW